MSAAAAFYCVADSRYFPGAVGLVNSLRLVGHREPILVLDTGLTDAQRALLEPQAEIVPSPSDAPPWLLKTVAPLSRPAAVMVLLDADLVVTRPLTDLIEARERAAGGVSQPDRQVRAGMGRAARPRDGAAARLPELGRDLRRALARGRGARPDAGTPAGGRLRAHPLAARPAGVRVHVRRPGRLQRDPRHPDRPERVVALDQRLAATPRSPACGWSTSAPCAAPTRTPPRRIWSIITP